MIVSWACRLEKGHPEYPTFSLRMTTLFFAKLCLGIANKLLRCWQNMRRNQGRS